MQTKRIIFSGLMLLFAALFSACATTDSSTKSAKKTADHLNIYEVHRDGRINVFYNKKIFEEYMALGETSYRLTRIGAGPHGETVVFGLTKKDKKLKKPIAAIELYDGKIKAGVLFYAELHKHGRIYVFDRFEDMKTVRDFGHPNYMHTKIGAGPHGETVVFVLNKKNKKKHPTRLITIFNNKNAG